MKVRESRSGWVWVFLMLAATAWYAWPQLVYSLLPVYDILGWLFPGLAHGIQPWIDSMRHLLAR